MREQVAIYDGVEIPRTRENEERYWRGGIKAKKHPKYVYGRVGLASLIHKVAYVNMQWYESSYTVFYRLKSPILTAHTVCGNMWRIGTAGRGNVCEVPRPDSILCAMCHGEGRNFGKHGKNTVTKRQAKDHLGCVVQGVSR
jgi:hypothetical protein